MKLHSKSLFFFCADIMCAAVSAFLAMFLRFDFQVSDMISFVENYGAFVVMLPAFSIVFGSILGTYRALYVNFSYRDAIRQIMAAGLTAIAILLCHIIFQVKISTGICLFYVMIYALFTLAVRSFGNIYKMLVASRALGGKEVKRAVIIGAGFAGSTLIHMLMSKPDMKIRPVAVLDDNPVKQGMSISGIKVKGAISSVVHIAKEKLADEIIVAIPSADSEQLKKIFEECKKAALPIKSFGDIADFNEFVSGKKKEIKNLSVEDLLFRDSVKTDMSVVAEYISGKSVLVTGGAGSIGSEICRQVLEYGCRHLVIMDINENGLFFLRNDLLEKYPQERFCVRVGSVRDKVRMDYLFKRHKFDIVFHAAAHKHVPLMEENLFEAVKNNVIGTKNTIECCIENKADRFVLISTDKAVNPTNVMGATKRVAELLVRRYNGQGCELSAVRFGNVLGSNGSVIPIFQKQIMEGGPVTVTHREIMRYFMTIPEAVSLVLNAGVRAEGGEIFVLDMGKPVNIYDLAYSMIELAGFVPDKDIEIKITGLRPGEKLFEELKLEGESFTKTAHDKIFVMHDEQETEKVDENIERLESMIADDCGEEALREALFATISVDFEKSAERGKDLSAFSDIC